MKSFTIAFSLALIGAAPLPAFAGRDQGQLLLQERAYANLAQTQARSQPRSRQAAAGPAGNALAAREGAPADRQLELLKRFHPKHAYGN